MPYYQRQLPSQSSPLAYELPDQRYLQPVGTPNIAPQGGGLVSPLQRSNDPLAEVEGLTNKYYDTYGKLDALAKSMWLDEGIDITKPDITQPGGGLPFQGYQRIAAELLHTANQLSNRQKQEVQMRPYEAMGHVIKNGDQYETQELLPEVQDVLQKLKGPFYNQVEADRAKQRLVGPALQQLLQRGDLNDPLVRHNIEVLRGAGTTYSTYPGLYTFQPREDALDKARLKAVAGAQRETGVLKRFTALKNGFWEQGSYQMEQDPTTGQPQYSNKAHEGEIMGSIPMNNPNTGTVSNIKRIVDKWVRKPDGSTWVEFKQDPETQVTPSPLRVDNIDGADLTAQFQQSNPKFGQSPNMFQAIDLLGLADPNNVGSLNEPALYNAEQPTGYQQLLDARNMMGAQLNSRVEKAKVLRTQLDQLIDSGSIFNKKSVEIPLPSGEKVTITTNRTNDKLNVNGEDMTKDKVEEYLRNKGYFEQGSDQPQSTTKPGMVKMQLPNGNIKLIPSENVQTAVSRGAKVIE